jgi:hypothetical protein
MTEIPFLAGTTPLTESVLLLSRKSAATEGSSDLTLTRLRVLAYILCYSFFVKMSSTQRRKPDVFAVAKPTQKPNRRTCRRHRYRKQIASSEPQHPEARSPRWRKTDVSRCRGSDTKR